MKEVEKAAHQLVQAWKVFSACCMLLITHVPREAAIEAFVIPQARIFEKYHWRIHGTAIPKAKGPREKPTTSQCNLETQKEPSSRSPSSICYPSKGLHRDGSLAANIQAPRFSKFARSKNTSRPVYSSQFLDLQIGGAAEKLRGRLISGKRELHKKCGNYKKQNGKGWKILIARGLKANTLKRESWTGCCCLYSDSPSQTCPSNVNWLPSTYSLATLPMLHLQMACCCLA